LGILILALATLLLDSLFAVSANTQYVWTVAGIAAVLVVPVCWWTRNRFLAIALTGFLLLLLMLQYVSFAPGKLNGYHRFFKRISPGMTRNDVLSQFQTIFPDAATDGWPRITRQRAERITMVLDPSDGRYNSELIVIYFKNDQVTGKLYAPD
jgi:hypothetical protein